MPKSDGSLIFSSVAYYHKQFLDLWLGFYGHTVNLPGRATAILFVRVENKKYNFGVASRCKIFIINFIKIDHFLQIWIAEHM